MFRRNCSTSTSPSYPTGTIDIAGPRAKAIMVIVGAIAELASFKSAGSLLAWLGKNRQLLEFLYYQLHQSVDHLVR